MNNKDNQQGRHAYLAGIVDGEGSISTQCVFDKVKKTLRITPFVNVSNSDPKIIDYCIDIIQSIDSKYHSYWYKYKYNKRPICNLRIDGWKSVDKILITIMPYLVGKQKQAELLMSFINSRRSNLIIRNSNGRINRRRPYSDDEMRIVFDIKSLNRHVPSETIRQTFIDEGRYSPNSMVT